MAGGHAPPPKQEELLPHPAKDQLLNIAYCITSPPPWREFSEFFYVVNIFLCVCCLKVVMDLRAHVFLVGMFVLWNFWVCGPLCRFI